jgi:hypothetical protein
MLLTHPTILSISIHGVEYRPDDGVFDMPDNAAAIALADFGMTEAKSGRPKRAKAGGPASAKAKPRSRKPKAKPQGEGIIAFPLLIGTEAHRYGCAFPFRSPLPAAHYTFGAAYALRAIPYGKGYKLPVAGSYSFTPSFCAPQPYINYKIQDTSCKMETVAVSGSASCIYHISDRIWPYCTDSGSGEAVSPEPSSAPSNPVAWHGRQTGPSTGAYLSGSGSWPGNLLHLAPNHGARPNAERYARRYHRAGWVPGETIHPTPSFAPSNPVARYGFPTGPSPGA